MNTRKAGATKSILHSALCILHSAFARFARDERGQGIVFAAATLVMLVGFVALVVNIGRVIENRTRAQLAADSAVYSGAMVEANALSAIAWTNSAMAQIYYHSLRYAVNVNVTGAAAELEHRKTGAQGGPAWTAYQAAYASARDALPQAKAWMADLSRIQNAIAILTPRLMQEEMHAVSQTAGMERLSIYPSYRLFPHAGSTGSWRIERFDNGWRIRNIDGGNGEMLYVYLQGSEWHFQYSEGGGITQEVVIEQQGPDQWRIRYYEPPGSLRQEVLLVRTDDLGWIVSGSTIDEDGNVSPVPPLRFERVDMDGDGYAEGTRVISGDFSQVIRRGENNDLFIWNSDLGAYVNMTSSQTTIGGVNVQLNVTNEIRFPGATAHIGDPTSVTIGRTHIVLTDPPRIQSHIGPVHLSIRGFDPDAFSLSVGGFNLTRHDADGRWRKWYHQFEDLWTRHRLTAQQPADGAQEQWQYDNQVLGAHMIPEPNMQRFVILNGFGPNGYTEEDLPPWAQWFDLEPRVAAPKPTPALEFEQVDRPDDGGSYLRLTDASREILQDESIYYLAQHDCPRCDGVGGAWAGEGAARQWTICEGCQGKDYDGDEKTDIYVFPTDVASSVYLGNTQSRPVEERYLDVAMFRPGYNDHSGQPLPTPQRPLVLAEEFFQYGINVGAWKEQDGTMLFPQNTAPQWGYTAISSARIGIPDATQADGFRYAFDSPNDRQDWVLNSPSNLYAANIRARLFPARDQVRMFDLDRHLLQGVSLAEAEESGLSYLWHAILGTARAGHHQHSNWTDRYDGRPDMPVGQSTRNMVNRRGQRFDYGHQDMDKLVQH